MKIILNTSKKVVSLYQIIGGATGLIFTLKRLIDYKPNMIGLLGLFYFSAILLNLFSCYAGYQLFKRATNGISLSQINQANQTVLFSVLGISYHFSAGLNFILGIDLTEKAKLILNLSPLPLWKFSLNSESIANYMGINIIPILVLLLLHKLGSSYSSES